MEPVSLHPFSLPPSNFACFTGTTFLAKSNQERCFRVFRLTGPTNYVLLASRIDTRADSPCGERLKKSILRRIYLSG